LIFGIITLAKGKLTLTSSKVVYGAPARVIGVILTLPLPLALLVGFLIGFTMAAQGKPAEGKDMLKFAPIDLGLVAAALLASLGIALATAERPRRKRRPAFEDEYEEEYEERPRRRRRRDEDE